MGPFVEERNLKFIPVRTLIPFIDKSQTNKQPLEPLGKSWPAARARQTKIPQERNFPTAGIVD